MDMKALSHWYFEQAVLILYVEEKDLWIGMGVKVE